VLEAMAAGRAVVASDVSGTDEVVVNGHTGLLVPPGEPSALAAAIEALVQDTGLRERLGQAGAERVRDQFSAAAMIEHVAAVYDELLRPCGLTWADQVAKCVPDGSGRTPPRGRPRAHNARIR
jgi:glycosyltransferase involved in cell wall biosynthesis